MKQTKSRTIKDSFTTKIKKVSSCLECQNELVKMTDFKSFLVTAGQTVAYQLNALFVENILAAKCSKCVCESIVNKGFLMKAPDRLVLTARKGQKKEVRLECSVGLTIQGIKYKLKTLLTSTKGEYSIMMKTREK